MSDQKLSIRQACVLFILLAVQRNEQSVGVHKIEDCFSNLAWPVKESTNAALVALEQTGYVVLLRSRKVVVSARLTHAGRLRARVIPVGKIFLYVNYKAIDRVAKSFYS